MEVWGGINLGQGHRDVAVCRPADVGVQPDLVLYRVLRPVADVHVGGSHLKDPTPVTQHVGKGHQLVGRGLSTRDVSPVGHLVQQGPRGGEPQGAGSQRLVDHGGHGSDVLGGRWSLVHGSLPHGR